MPISHPDEHKSSEAYLAKYSAYDVWEWKPAIAAAEDLLYPCKFGKYEVSAIKKICYFNSKR